MMEVEVSAEIASFVDEVAMKKEEKQGVEEYSRISGLLLLRGQWKTTVRPLNGWGR